jgi:hypothetical protein
LYPGGDVVSVGEVEFAGVLFNVLPVEVEEDGVEAHCFGHLEALAPEGARNSLGVNLTTYNLVFSAIHVEVVSVPGE